VEYQSFYGHLIKSLLSLFIDFRMEYSTSDVTTLSIELTSIEESNSSLGGGPNINLVSIFRF